MGCLATAAGLGAVALAAATLSGCGKDASPGPAPQTTTNGYIALVSEVRSQGMATKSQCEREPLTPSQVEELHQAEAKIAQARGQKTAAERKPLAELVTENDGALVLAVNRRVLAKANERGTRALTRPERAIYFFNELDGEVRNGGFHQFFSNSSGDCAREALAAVRDMGLESVEKTYERALALFPDAPAPDRATRNAQMSRVPDEFSAWRAQDSAYYALRDTDAAIARYLRSHITEIDPPAP